MLSYNIIRTESSPTVGEKKCFGSPSPYVDKDRAMVHVTYFCHWMIQNDWEELDHNYKWMSNKGPGDKIIAGLPVRLDPKTTDEIGADNQDKVGTFYLETLPGQENAWCDKETGTQADAKAWFQHEDGKKRCVDEFAKIIDGGCKFSPFLPFLFLPSFVISFLLPALQCLEI
jgi:hypothetical protein